MIARVQLLSCCVSYMWIHSVHSRSFNLSALLGSEKQSSWDRTKTWNLPWGDLTSCRWCFSTVVVTRSLCFYGRHPQIALRNSLISSNYACFTAQWNLTIGTGNWELDASDLPGEWCCGIKLHQSWFIFNAFLWDLTELPFTKSIRK